MTITKYASMEILESSSGTLRKTAHRVDFEYEVRPDYIYVVSRAISSRCNDNYDHFGADEIKAGWRSFIGKPVFVNHENDNHKRARGVIINAALHEDKNRDGSPDTWVAVLMEIDARTFPKLAAEILAGNIERTSMGVDVERSECSACGNVATTPMEYCAHIPKSKGQMIIATNHRTGSKEPNLIYESCYGLHFFENSLLVEPPADPTAFFLSVDASGLKGQKTGSVTVDLSSAAGELLKLAKSSSALAYAMRDKVFKQAQSYARSWKLGELSHVAGTADTEALATAYNKLPVFEASALSAFAALEKETDRLYGYLTNKCGVFVVQTDYKPYENLSQMASDVSNGVLKVQATQNHPYFSTEAATRFQAVRAYFGTLLGEADDISWGYLTQLYSKTAQKALLSETLAKSAAKSCLSKIAVLELTSARIVRPGPEDDDIPHEQLPDGHPGKDAFYVAHQQATGHRPSHHNIVQSYHEANEDERHRGANWYKNAQFVGESLAKNSPRLKADHGDEHGNVDSHTARNRGAGVLAHMSAGVGWYHNMDNASEAFRKGHAEPGKGRGRQITDVMAHKANAVLDQPKGQNDYSHSFDDAQTAGKVKKAGDAARAEGRPDHEVKAAEEEARSGVKGPNVNGSYANSPKTRNFAHLIEHGGDEDHNGTPSRRVVVDRHALSVAMGKRMTTQDMASWKPNGHHYDYVANMYRRAADHISKEEGRTVHPHEVQAVTWLRQKRKNDEADLQKVQEGDNRAKAQFNNGDKQLKTWKDTVQEHHPDLQSLKYGPGDHQTGQHNEQLPERPWHGK